MEKAVIDTDVMVSALRSRQGASYKLIEMMFQGAFQVVVSVPMVFEYEAILSSQFVPDIYTSDDITGFVDSKGIHV